MSEQHYQHQISSYINDELPSEQRQVIAAHFLRCGACREEHDSIKRVARLAGMLERADAPVDTWNVIETALVSGPRDRFSLFNFKLVPVAASLIVLLLTGTALYFGVVRKPRGEQTAGQPKEIVAVPIPPAPKRVAAPEVIALAPTPGPIQPVTPPIKDVPSVRPPTNPPTVIGPVIAKASWDVETLAGRPTIANSEIRDKLVVGETLETDAHSRARIEVADIGQVEVAPNSRVRLLRSDHDGHRLSLDRGSLHAKISAPPRLFIVDTPSAVAVDLGCEYTLEVDPTGNSKLHVTAGFVSLEREGRDSLVPAGAYCLTKRGQGLGTPYFAGSSPAFETALAKFDFSHGGAASLATIVSEAGAEDTLTLWHLLPRTTGADREKVFATLLSFVELPPGVTRAGILKLDQQMLETWRKAMEELWFG
jgi:hypothetical protein